MNETTKDRAESRAFQFSGRIRSFRYAIAGIVRWPGTMRIVGLIHKGY